MLKKLLPLVVLAFWGPYSYSDSISPYYGYTGNAASNGLGWSMDSVFPDPPGLDVNAVLYNYTIQKQVEDSVTVNVQNENALGTGYIFRETDEWRPGSLGGTEINKVIGLPNIPRSYWGDGSIEVEGNGSVTDPSVIYSYRVDPCYDPQFDPNCPGYEVPIPVIPEIDLSTLYDATKDENVDLDRKTEIDQNEENLEENEKDKEEAEEELKRKYRLEKAMAAVDAGGLFADSNVIKQMNDPVFLEVQQKGYYSASIPGGVYPETIALDGGQLQDNKQGRRMNMSSQILHDKMVDMQYNR